MNEVIMAQSKRLPSYKMYTIGWIAALDKELTAALSMLDGEQHGQPEDFDQNDKDSNTYLWGQIGDHNIVIASLGAGSYGLVSAAATATYMATSLPHLRFGLMVGIGAGVPAVKRNNAHYEVDTARDIRLGDIVVSQPANGHAGVVQYDLGKQKGEDHFESTAALASPPKVLLNALNNLKSKQRRTGSQVPEILAKAIEHSPMLGEMQGNDNAFIYQGAHNDRLFESASIHVPSDESQESITPTAVSRAFAPLARSLRLPLAWVWYLICIFYSFLPKIGSNATEQHLVKVNRSGSSSPQANGETKSCPRCEKEIHRPQRTSENPQVHYGTIASGNLVIKNGTFRDQISKRLGTDVLCYEMEAAGLMNDFPCLVIRGICDYADSHKNDRWQNYAAIVAAAYAKELLGVIDARSVKIAKKLEDIMATVSEEVSQLQSTAQQIDRNIKVLADKQMVANIVSWLGAPDPSGNQKDAFAQHHADTGKWLLRSEAYKGWKTAPASSLWLYGMPGCGKTVLSSVVINDLEGSKSDSGHVLSFYFTFADSAKQSLDGALRSLIYQLFRENLAAQECLATLHDSTCLGGSKQPSTDKLREAFEKMIRSSNEVWIVLDALDECQLIPTFSNNGLLEWLQSILNEHANLHVVVTSRPDQQIKMALDGVISKRIDLQCPAVDNDIRMFIDSTVRNWKALGDWENHQNVKDEIKDHLTKNSHGMFRWVTCQLYALAPLAGARDHHVLRDTLYSLPATLDETYARIINETPEKMREKAKRVLQFLLYSETPVLATEAFEIAQVSPNNERFKRRMNTSMKPDLQAILVYCPNLIKFVTEYDRDVGKVEVIQLSHFSVKEYLLSERLKEQTSWVFEEALVKASMADICLAYLLEIEYHESWDVALSLTPLAMYAAMFWVGFARQAKTALNTRLIKDFFDDPSCQITYYKLRQSVYRQYRNNGETMGRYTSSTQNLDFILQEYYQSQPEPLLHHLARGGVLYGVKAILQMDAKAVKTKGGHYGNPLQAAASQGHCEIVAELLNAGAIVDAYGGYYGSALISAVEGSHKETIRILLEHNATISDGSDVLWSAISYRGIEIVNMLLEKATVVSPEAFRVACENGDVDLVRRLSERIPSTDIVAFCNYAFRYACGTGHRRVLEFLLGMGADLDARDNKGCTGYVNPREERSCTGLYFAVKNSCVETVRWLLENGAKVNHKDINADPLYASTRWGRDDTICINIMRLLLEKDPNAKFFDESLLALSRKGRVNGVALLLETSKANHAIETKRMVLTQALVEAMRKRCQGYHSIVRLLLEHGADPNASIDARLSPDIRVIIDNGADVDLDDYNKNGTILLCYLLEEQRKLLLMWGESTEMGPLTEAFKALLDYGANPNRGCSMYGRAYGTARIARCDDIVRLLVAYGADKRKEPYMVKMEENRRRLEQASEKALES